MNENISYTFELKQGKTYVPSGTKSTDPVFVLERLAGELAAKYIGKAPYIRKIERKNNYDGTQTYTVYYNEVGMTPARGVYVVSIY